MIKYRSGHSLPDRISDTVLILDTGCTFEGYFADFDRNYALRSVDAATASAHHRTWDATEADLAVIELSHATCAGVFAAMHSVLVPGSAQKATSSVGRLGHGLGIQLTETPSITAVAVTNPLSAIKARL